MSGSSTGSLRPAGSDCRDADHPSRVRWILAAILLFAAVSRLLYLAAYDSDPYSAYLIHDARRYHEWASALASGLAWEGGAFYQAPLYPALVAAVYVLFGTRPVAAYALNLVFGMLTILLIFRVARRSYGSRAGLAAAGIASLYGSFLFYETKLLPASLTLLLAALLVDRMQAADAARMDWTWIGPGAVLGAAALANPGILPMALAGAAWMALDGTRLLRHRFLRIAWFVAGAALLVTPVAVRNHQVSGDWVLISANGGITFYQGNNPNALGVFSTPPGFSGSIVTQREESRRLAEAETGRKMGDGEISAFWFRKGLAFIGGEPLRWARLLATRFLLSVANEEQPLEYNPRLDENPFRWLVPLPFGAILALAAARFHWRRGNARSDRSEHPILLLMLVEGIVLVAFYVSGRYRLPAAPALIAMAGCGVGLLLGRSGRGARRALAPAATAVLVAALSFAYVPVAHGVLRDQQAAMGLVDRAEALWSAGRRGAAIEALRRSVALDPALPEIRLNLGRSLREAGRADEAQRVMREALGIDPGSIEARFDLGVLCVQQGRYEEAAALFEEALRRDPASANVANNLLGVLTHLGRTDRAVEVWREMKTRGLPVDPSLDRTMRAREGGQP